MSDRPARTRRPRRRWRIWLRRTTFIGVLVVIAMVGGGFVALNSVKIPAPTRTIKTTSFVCTAEVADGECDPSNSVAQFASGGNNRVLVDLTEISDHLIDAVVAAEDRSFFSHGGVDPWGIARAFYRDVRGSASRQGGSTITQQYVKQVYLTNEGTLKRKIKEAAIAIKLERKLSKPEILERYLNEVYLGRGAVGVEAGARAYFDKDAKDLDIAESAFLAGLIRAPRYADEPTNPDKPEEAKEAKRRRRTVLTAMLEEKYISAEEERAAEATPLDGHVLLNPPVTKGPVVRSTFSDVGGKYVIEWARQQLVEMENVGESALYGQGLRIYLTIDPRLQAAAQLSIASVLNEPGDPSSSLMSVDDAGRIVAMIGGQNFEASEVNLALGAQGGGSGRGPGSTFKPIALAEYIAQGNSVKSEIWAPAQHIYPGADDGADWTVDNYENKDLGKLTIEQATWQSANTAYSQIMEKITPQKFREMALRLGVSAEVKPVLSSVLGPSAVSVMDMTSVYSTFANHGTLKPPYVIRRVEAADGSVLYDAAQDPLKQPQQAIDPAVADTVSSVLTGVLASGTGSRARLKTKAAGKTGTTKEYRDAWFAGYTCHVTAVVWMGFLGEPGQPVPLMDNVHGIKVTGGSLPADIWRTYMSAATDGQRGCAFKATDAGTTLVPPNEEFAPTTLPPVVVPPPADGTPPPEGGPATTAPAAPATTAAPAQP